MNRTLNIEVLAHHPDSWTTVDCEGDVIDVEVEGDQWSMTHRASGLPVAEGSPAWTAIIDHLEDKS
ncbi:hypothetical protein [Corynebacterium glyciniphilum]|uniref:hypothetical protein n=1 Tax=Corynebacterium glyciniphilum TaxID=1404244 RepID=UPI003FD3F1C6